MSKKKYSKYGAKARKSYVSDKAYLEAIYRANKDFIDQRQVDIGYRKSGKRYSDKYIFVQNVLWYQKTKGVGITKAVDLTLRSRTYQTIEEMYKRNVRKSLISSGKYKEFRELTKERGRYTKFDETKLKYNPAASSKGYKEYIYDTHLKIVYMYDYNTGTVSIKLIPLKNIPGTPPTQRSKPIPIKGIPLPN